jgi:hypothetical protein
MRALRQAWAPLDLTVEEGIAPLAPLCAIESSTREVRGRIVHWQANEWLLLWRYTLSISSQIFQVLLARIIHESQTRSWDSLRDVL